jgi:F0F1-type ATP synthase membrane subunit c/vacuolar-type H+-ATPase subunit K
MVDIKEEEGKSTIVLIVETIAALMTAAFGFVAALAWNTAIQEALKQVFPNPGDLTGMFVYAIIITVVAVIAIVLIGRVLAKYKARDSKRNCK